MKKTILITLATLYSMFASAQTSWKWLIKPQYESLIGFSEGLAAAKLKGKWGYINSKGKWVIPADYTAAASFSEGLAAVGKGKEGGFINQKNKVMIAFRKGYFNSFSNGRAVYFKPSNKPNASPYETTYGFVDKNGKMVIAPTRNINPNVSYTFSEGYCKVMGQQSMFIDKMGKPMKMTPVSDAQDFSEGLTAVQSASGPKWGFMDQKGKIVISPQFYEVSYGGFQKGLCAVALQYDKWVYIDRTGKPQFGQTFKGAEAFSDGLAAVAKDDVNGQKRFGFIDRTGKMIISPQLKPNTYKACSDGMIAFKKGTKWGFMNRNGQVVIQPQFEQVGNFVAGKCVVKYSGQWGVIQKK